MEEQVILVDTNDVSIGTEEKMAAHRAGKLHRAFSIFVFNNKREVMLQQRASTKYHCPGLWTNTCCSHPRPGEETSAAAERRLKEEMGFVTELKEIFSFTYRVEFDNGLTEHEFDHVFIGRYDGEPILNPAEAEAWRWVSLPALEKEMEAEPEQFTYWLKECFEQLKLSPLFGSPTV